MTEIESTHARSDCGMRAAPDAAAALALRLKAYLRRWPREQPMVLPFLELLDDPDDPFLRQRMDGHFTAGAWLVSRDAQRLLMTHHRRLGRWLQLGGHADGMRDMAQVALKEAREESGLPGLALESDAIFDLDRHWIPERRDVPGHWHFDALCGASDRQRGLPGRRGIAGPGVAVHCRTGRRCGRIIGAHGAKVAGRRAFDQGRAGQYSTRVRSVPSIAPSASLSRAACSSLAVTSITT